MQFTSHFLLPHVLSQNFNFTENLINSYLRCKMSTNNKIVRLNVGGEKFTTTIGTLTMEPDSMVAKLVSEEWLSPDSDENDQPKTDTTCKETKEIFIDRYAYKS